MQNDIDFQKLIAQGHYQEIIRNIDTIIEPSDRELLYKCEALIYEGSFDKANEIVSDLIGSEVILIRVEATRQKSLIHWSLGELSQSNNFSDQAINLINSIDDTQIEGKAIKAHVYHTYGTINQSIGQLDESLKYLQKSLEISKEINYKHRIAATMANMGIVYSYKGDMEKTLEHYNNAVLILQQLGSTNDEALVLGLLAETYWENGSLDKAINFKILSLNILRKTTNYYRIADALSVLINFLVLNKMVETAKKYYQDLVEINSQSEAYNITFMTKYSEALILKFSPRIKQKIAAQEIFEELLLEELDFEIRSEIVLHLSDLLIDELRTYSEPVVLNELLKLSDQIYQMAQSQKNNYLTIEALILKGKMELINTDFKQADKLFGDAHKIAKESGYDFLADKADFEIKQLQNDIESWQELLVKGASIKERVDRSKIRNYLERILSINRFVASEDSHEKQFNFKFDQEIIKNTDS